MPLLGDFSVWGSKMKELKVRAWHKANNNFVYSTLQDIWKNGFHVGQCYEVNNSSHIMRDNTGLYANESFFSVCGAFNLLADWELFTGHSDMNGKEIYEGDIVDQAVYLEDDPCPFSVVFEDGAFRVKHREWDENLMKPVFDSRYLAVMVHAVLGNIHENPELLVK